MVFSLDQEQFAIELSSAREVIEIPEYRSIPNTVPYFLGYFNLRGEVVGLIDLRSKFSFKNSRKPSRSAIIFEGDIGTLAAMVDKIDRIATFTHDQIEKKPKIKSRIPQEYLEGISKMKEHNFIFLNLHKIVTEDDWIKVKAVGS